VQYILLFQIGTTLCRVGHLPGTLARFRYAGKRCRHCRNLQHVVADFERMPRDLEFKLSKTKNKPDYPPTIWPNGQLSSWT